MSWHRLKYLLCRWEVQTGYGPEDHVRWRTKREAMAYSEGITDAVEQNVSEHVVWRRGPVVRRHPRHRRFWYFEGPTYVDRDLRRWSDHVTTRSFATEHREGEAG